MKKIPTKNARRRFRAVRDQNGVPHIEGNTFQTCLYGLGYLHALDRPTQMLFSRSVAQGKGTEQIADNPDLLDTDHFFRRAGLDLGLKEETGQLDDIIFGQLTAYCEGLNDGMQDGGRSLPMWATGFKPHPWTQESVLLIGNLLSFGGLAVGQQQSERLLIELIQHGIDEERLRELFDPYLAQADFELLRKVKMAHRMSDEALELIADLPRLAGSNAWAISPGRSASGQALLAGDPHLEINRLPAIWYEAVLRWEDQYLMGASLPGCPLFGVARTKTLAWAVTYLKGDTSDFFVEKCRRGGQSGWQFRRGNAWHDFSLREEVIERKGGKPISIPIYYNDLGTLECNPESAGEGYYLSVSWAGTAAGAGHSIATWLKLIACQNTKSAMDTVRENPQPTLSWIFADKQGHIGKQASGWMPIRGSGQSGLLPVAAWDESNHWQGWHPTELLPRQYDPPEGFVAAANEDINTEESPVFVTMCLPEYRYRRINERLRELPSATISDMQELQYDVVSLQARDLLEIFLPHLPEGEIKQRLTQWPCDYAPESREASLFQRLYRNILLEIFGQSSTEHGGIGWRRMFYLGSRIGYSTMVLTAIDRLLKKDRSAWWRNRDKGELIRRAYERLKTPQEKRWSEVNAFRFTNRFFDGHRAGRLLGFRMAEMALPGNHATPFQGHLFRSAKRESTFAPSYHFVTDLGSDEAWTNLPGGPSESRFSRYYKIDIPRWAEGKYKRLCVSVEPKKGKSKSHR
jgi:penicillin amidase